MGDRTRGLPFDVDIGGQKSSGFHLAGRHSEKALLGARVLDKQLEMLSDAVAARVMRRSLGHALNQTLALARAAVPERTKPMLKRTYKGRLVAPGFARRSTYISTSINRQTGNASATIGVRHEAFYAIQFIEFGFRDVPPRPWLVPAFKATRGTMLASLTSALRKNIDRAIARGRTGAKR